MVPWQPIASALFRIRLEPTAGKAEAGQALNLDISVTRPCRRNTAAERSSNCGSADAQVKSEGGHAPSALEPPMLTVSKDCPLLTTITGSLPRPHWFVQNLQGRPFSVAMTDISFREQYTDAVSAYLSDQKRAGLDLLTDGDARCDCDVGGRSWFSYATERLQGLEGYHVGRGRTASSRDKAAGDIMFEVLETRVLPNVTGPVRRGPLEYSRVWKVAQRQTRKPVKFGAISGQMVATGVHDVHFKNRRDLIMALSATMNEEL